MDRAAAGGGTIDGGTGGATGGVGGGTGGVGGATGGAGGKGGVGGGTGGVGGKGGVGGGTGGVAGTGGATGGVGGGTGGTVSTGGVGGGTGGVVATGGIGGGTGGVVATGGVVGTGGVAGTGGVVATGGVVGTGGNGTGGTGPVPVVTFATPTAGAILCPSGATATGCIDDNDTGTSGWQGSLIVHVTASGSDVNGSVVTFTAGATTLGTATTDITGIAALSGATVPEGAQTILATTDSVPGAGVGTGSVAVTVDTLAPNAPTGLLNATIPSVTDNPTARRKVLIKLSWTAPSDAGGGKVAGYQVRYSKTPIVTQADFDAATKYPYSTPPGNPGDTETIPSVIPLPPLSPLYIENDYYFAVEATDISGTAGPMLTSASPGTGQTCDCTSGRCCAAHFNVTALTGSSGSATEGAGFTMDGSGDADRDGLSDVLIGSFNNSRAYLFLGSSNFTPTAASVTFSSAATGFGRGVAFVGDIDHDGREDLAIANRSTGVIYIYRGRDSWPMTMADTDADFTITSDTSYSGSLFGTSMSRLGDFDGDGIDDFAIGAPDFNTSTLTGRVTIIRGSDGFTNVTLPDTTRAIVIDGDPAITFVGFGAQVLGIGPFYSQTGPGELIVSAPGFAGASLVGRIYAFRGQSASGGSISLSSADSVVVGASAGMRLGAVLTDLGGFGDCSSAGRGRQPERHDRSRSDGVDLSVLWGRDQ